jgi:hypothetical protein
MKSRPSGWLGDPRGRQAGQARPGRRAVHQERVAAGRVDAMPSRTTPLSVMSCVTVDGCCRAACSGREEGRGTRCCSRGQLSPVPDPCGHPVAFGAAARNGCCTEAACWSEVVKVTRRRAPWMARLRDIGHCAAAGPARLLGLARGLVSWISGTLVRATPKMPSMLDADGTGDCGTHVAGRDLPRPAALRDAIDLGRQRVRALLRSY